MNRSHHFASILIILSVSVIIYANTLKNGFVYDDVNTIVNNHLIKNFSNLPLLFGENYFAQSGEMSYRPVVTFTYFMDYAVYGLKPWGFHLTNLLLHASNGALLYILLTLFFRESKHGRRKSFFITLLFVSHPVLTEAVNAISFREDIIVSSFYIATLIIYLSISSRTIANYTLSGTNPYKLIQDRLSSLLYVFSCLLYFLALLSKEIAVMLPFMLYFYEWIRSDRRTTQAYIPNSYIVGYIATLSLYIGLRFYYFHNPLEGFHGPLLIQGLPTVPLLLLNYLKLCIFPVSLSADYVIMPVESISVISFLITIMTMVIFLFTAIMSMRKNSGISFGALLFIMTLTPVFHRIVIASPLAERYLYLPTIGFSIIAGMFIHYMYEATKLKLKTLNYLVLISFLTLMIINSIHVIKRNEIWRDGYSLWSDTVKKMPGSSIAHNNLGLVYVNQGKIDNAIQEFQTVKRLNPYDLKARFNLGSVYIDKRMFHEAIEQFEAVIGHASGDQYLHNKLGIAYAKLGRLDEALKEFLAAAELDANNSEFIINTGIAYQKLDRIDDAIQEFQNALKLDPNSILAHGNLGIAYFKKGLKYKARMEFERVLKLKPDDLEAKKALEVLGREEIGTATIK